MKHKRLRKRTKDSENGGGTEKASEKKTNSENIEALYERLIKGKVGKTVVKHIFSMFRVRI